MQKLLTQSVKSMEIGLFTVMSIQWFLRFTNRLIVASVNTAASTTNTVRAMYLFRFFCLDLNSVKIIISILLILRFNTSMSACVICLAFFYSCSFTKSIVFVKRSQLLRKNFNCVPTAYSKAYQATKIVKDNF